VSEDAAARRFGLRLTAGLAAAALAIVAVGYVVLSSQLRQAALDTHAAAQRADVSTFRTIAAKTDGDETIREIGEVLTAVGRRPGTKEAMLVARGGVVVASGTREPRVGEREDDARLLAALRTGASYVGTEADPDEDPDDLELIVPVSLPEGRFAYELTFHHETLEGELADVRRTMMLLGLATLLGGGVIFYLVGGRSLLRSHRRSLERATRDGLTDLPNQRAFHDELPQAVAAASRFQQHLSLAVLDIDDFKFANDRNGHQHGDELLRRVAAVLLDGRAGDRAYRVGGDEFALVLSHTDGEGARTLMGRVNRALAARDVTMSIGLSELRPGVSADDLREEADAALYETKRRGGGDVTNFAEIRDLVEVTTASKRDAVRRLIDEGRLTTVFQPIWDLEAEELVGVEALSRPDPSYGLAGPAEAFAIAEQLGRVHELDVLCARRALAAGAALPGYGGPLFVNLSPLTLDLDADGNDWFVEAVEAAGLVRERIVVEVTERFGGRVSAVVKALERMRELGFRVALDDVGTGNSGLEMLRRVGAEFVKIDGSIVSAAATEPNARAVLLAMATFAHQTGSFVIAEGIEDAETVEFLRHVHEHAAHTGQIIRGGQGFALGVPASGPPQRPAPFGS